MNLNPSFHKHRLVQRSIKVSAVLLFTILPFFLRAQVQGEVAPDFMRSIGKIYVVAAVCLVILLTLLVYLVLLDRKITRLEKQHKNE